MARNASRLRQQDEGEPIDNRFGMCHLIRTMLFRPMNRFISELWFESRPVNGGNTHQ